MSDLDERSPSVREYRELYLRDLWGHAVTFGLCIAMLVHGCEGHAYSPIAHPECLDRSSDLSDLRLEPWERRALSAITTGRIGKGPVDYIQISHRETAIGFLHLTAQRDPLRLNIQPEPLASNLSDYWAHMLLLYSDHAASLQIKAWRRLVGPAIRAATEAGHKEGHDLIAGIANSSPRMAERLVRSCHSLCCMAKGYARGSEHRERRVRLLGYGGCLS